MKIAFVSLNRERLPDPVVPLGLLYVMASTPPGHERELWDLCFERDPHASLRARARAFAPDLVAVGMRNVQSADYSGVADNLREYAALLAILREHTGAPIVLGGGGFSVMPRELMLALSPDYGIAGEGERAFPALVTALETGAGGLERIGGLYSFEGEALREVPRAPDFQHLDALAPPARDAIDPRYYARCGTDSVQTKRGCPMQCTYCTYPRIEGSLSRQRSPERVADELEEIARRGAARHVFVVDSTFNLPPSHAKAVCRAMIARGLRLPWTCYVNPIAFDDELAELMARAGCAGMEVGTDSGDDAVLAALKKGFTTHHVRDLSARARAAGLRDCHTFV
ncbi:MAG: radical SAM protein, partial [Sandaracinaceae bacterium]|nr:radical SAM protein [Sandaracinaceae bacterium]